MMNSIGAKYEQKAPMHKLSLSFKAVCTRRYLRRRSLPSPAPILINSKNLTAQYKNNRKPLNPET
jgi:hypothetical protein